MEGETKVGWGTFTFTFIPAGGGGGKAGDIQLEGMVSVCDKIKGDTSKDWKLPDVP